MPNTWVGQRTAVVGGYHRVLAQAPGGQVFDITFLRDAPIGVASYSSADPFSDATASLSFPQLGPLDDPGSPELAWLREDTLIDIWWIPAMAVPHNWDPSPNTDTALWLNPITNEFDIICPAWDYQWDGHHWNRLRSHRGQKVWEGQISGLGVSQDDRNASMTASCVGALFQADLINAKPFYPPRPQTVESLILGVFDKERTPSLRTQQAHIDWPDGWALTAPAFTGSSNTFDPNVRPGAKWTGYTTRSTGSWDRQLTSYIQNMLATMITKPGCGVGVGMQWTLRNALQGDARHPAGRTPVLVVRDRDITETVAFWAGTTGIAVNLNRDATQKTNIEYGTGTDLGGTTWRGAVIASNGRRTDYMPLAFDPRVYPTHHNPARRLSEFVRESYVQYGTGFGQLDATVAAQQTVQRDIDPGWAGSVTLKVDPSPDVSRWTLRAGCTVRIQGFMGTGATGMRFHVAQVEANVPDGSVTLTVDTRYRDLITLTEAINRTRDALTPAKLLGLNRNSVTIEDIQAPWDYTAGSGFVPKPSRLMYRHMAVNEQFPYGDWVTNHPPKVASHRQWYVECDAKNANSQKRWAGPVPILMSEKGTIRRSEFFMVDRDGNLVRSRFHVSLYYFNGVNAAAMPNNGKIWSPWLTGAFDSIDPSTGQPWAKPNLKAPNSFVIGWGNYAQPAGYSPGLASHGAQPTGLLIDEGSWTFDCSANNKQYDPLAKAGGEKPAVITVYAMFYAEYSEKVYFGGRLFREEPGTTS